ncbi:MAG TPA: MMPL family transporter, partial [Burkholderiaceae bacterium]|nr:MMPL family transporter [Burkholderiaceae bacterium]
YRADLSAFLPAAPTAEQRVLLDQLRSGVTARLLLIGIRGGQAEQRQQASRELAQALRPGGAQAGQFDALHNGEGDSWKETGEFLFAHRYLLSPAVDAQRFTVDGLREAFDETVSVLGTPAGSLMKPLLWRDPTGETLRMAESMMSAHSPRSEGGVWVSRSEPRALLLATTHAEGADLDGQAAAHAAVRAAFAPWAAKGLTLELSGPGIFATQSRASIQHEVERLAWAGTAVMLGLLWLAFGSLRPLGVAMLPVASGVLAGIAAVALGFGTVHGMTLGFGTTLIGEAVDYAIYFLIQSNPPSAGAAGQGVAGRGYLTWLREQWPTVRLGLWTSVAGFAALVGSGFPGLAQLGVFSIAGLLAAAATTRWGLEGSYQTGGWTSDLYLVSPPELNRQQSSWSAGLAGSSQDLSLYGAAGFHHASRTQWRGPAGYIDGPVSNGGWGFLRWKRGGLRALVDADGIQSGRLAWLPDPEAFRPQVRWFWPQVEGSLGWVRSDANPWSEGDAVAGDLRVPILDDRVMVRLDAGGDGFHFLQVGSSIDPQGMVGLDLTWAVRDDQAYPGARLRLPVFTLSVNDPDEWYAHGNSNRLV